MNTFSKMFSAVLLSLVVTTNYAESTGFLALDNGYRWDRISNRATLGGPTISTKGSTQIIKTINSYQLGAKGQWYFCDFGFVRGAGHYGWAFDGKYSEGGFFGDSRGHTYDVNLAAGYYFCIHQSILFSPIAGWSYDGLNLRGTHIKTAIDGTVYHLSEIKAYQRYYGPFLGFDLVYNFNDCLDFTFGYECHFAHWRGNRLIQGEQYGNPPFGWTTGYDNKRSLNRVYGQVFKFDGSYQYCDGWTLGLGLKYQFYTGDFGRYRQKRGPDLSQFTYRNVDGLWWRSFGVTFSIGRVF